MVTVGKVMQDRFAGTTKKTSPILPVVSAVRRHGKQDSYLHANSTFGCDFTTTFAAFMSSWI